jgi:C4-type Zn-finger protein
LELFKVVIDGTCACQRCSYNYTEVPNRKVNYNRKLTSCRKDHSKVLVNAIGLIDTTKNLELHLAMVPDYLAHPAR